MFWLPRRERERERSMFIHQFWFIFCFGNWKKEKGVAETERVRESQNLKDEGD
jgi:hypothetical protein